MISIRGHWKSLVDEKIFLEQRLESWKIRPPTTHDATPSRESSVFGRQKLLVVCLFHKDLYLPSLKV
jgi:hypothetical protein